MNRIFAALAFIAFAAIPAYPPASAGQPQSSGSASPGRQLAKANNTFAVKRMTAAKLGEWVEKLDGQTRQQVDLYLPNFTMEAGYDLKPHLVKMGGVVDPTGK